MGPLNLDFLTAEIETAFEAPQAGIKASIEHTQLVWREWKRPFEIELVNVKVQKDHNPQWLTIKHIGVSLRLLTLLRGDASLKQLRLYNPHILLEKNENGGFSLGFGESQPNQEFSFEEFAPLLALGSSNPRLGKLNDLSKVMIIDAHVLLKDEQEDQTWELPKATFALKRYQRGFRTELTLHPQKGEGSLTLGLAHQIGSPRFEVALNFNHISFKELLKKEKLLLAPPTPGLMNLDDFINIFQNWDIPLQGKAYLSLIPKTLQIIEGVCDIDVGRGTLDLSGAKLLPLPVDSGNLSLLFTPHKIELKNLSLLSEEMLLQLKGDLSSSSSPLLLTNFLGASQNLSLEGKIEDLLLDHLAALWPQDLAQAARGWVTQNLRTGILSQGTFFLKGHGDEVGFIIDDLKGTLAGEGAEITYLEGLPPAQDVKAFATFDKQGFNIKIVSGHVKGISVPEGRVIISGLDGDNEALKLNLKAEGPLSSVLDVINHKPLEYATYGGIDPKKAKGTGKVDLNISFPLLMDLQFKDVNIALKGTFKKVEVERKITGELKAHLTEGDLNIDLTQDKMIIQGKGILNQLPSTVRYSHYFKKPEPYELEIQINTIASFEDFKRLGFDYLEYGKGPTKATLTYTLEPDKKSRLFVDLDITSSYLSFKPLMWEKKSGERAALSFALVFKDGQLATLKDLKMVSSLYSLRGAVIFGSDKSWKAIHLSEFKGPHTHTQATLHYLDKDTYEASFKGQSINLEKFLEYVNSEENAKDHPPTDIKLLADVGQLRLGEGKVFQAVKASANLFLQGENTTWKEVSLRAKAGTGTAYKGDMAHVSGGILFDITPGPNNTQKLEVRANDAGQFLKNLSIYDEIQGGYITIKAQRQNHGPFVGSFKLKQFDANEVPLLARFAALLSPMGLVNLFSERKTLSMDRFECQFEFDEDRISVTQGIGKSLSLGFTVEGKLDRKNRLFALKGNLVLARFLNSILSNIPLIGSFLNGGEGEGLFGIAFTVKGSFHAPKVTLNPLSIFAPGFIRQLFQSIDGDE